MHLFRHRSRKLSQGTSSYVKLTVVPILIITQSQLFLCGYLLTRAGMWSRSRSRHILFESQITETFRLEPESEPSKQGGKQLPPTPTKFNIDPMALHRKIGKKWAQVSLPPPPKKKLWKHF